MKRLELPSGIGHPTDAVQRMGASSPARR